jgi:hypothetical protein
MAVAIAGSGRVGLSAHPRPARSTGVQVEYTEAPSDGLRATAQTWIDDSIRAVATYYGEFPAPGAVLRISLRSGREPGHGQASGWKGPRVMIGLGREATAEDLADDWMLPHELLHLCFPSVARRHHWMEEGLSTYVESIARARANLLTPERAWSDLVNGLPQGEPAAGDKGLDHTPTWGRTYWGGALFWLKADVEIRKRTKNQRGLEHALRAIAAAGGTIEHDWEVDRILSVGDAATGVPVLRELYDEMKDAPVVVDLTALWQDLGILRRGRSVSFDDSAPFAEVRKAMMTDDLRR